MIDKDNDTIDEDISVDDAILDVLCTIDWRFYSIWFVHANISRNPNLAKVL